MLSDEATAEKCVVVIVVVIPVECEVNLEICGKIRTLEGAMFNARKV